MRSAAALFLTLFACAGLHAQFPAAVAAKCQVTEVRQVGLEHLIKMDCPENKLSMVVWLPPRERRPVAGERNVWTNTIPMGMGQDVHISPGRAPRSDYSKPKPVHLLILSTNASTKVTATLLSLTFH